MRIRLGTSAWSYDHRSEKSERPISDVYLHWIELDGHRFTDGVRAVRCEWSGDVSVVQVDWLAQVIRCEPENSEPWLQWEESDAVALGSVRPVIRIGTDRWSGEPREATSPGQPADVLTMNPVWLEIEGHRFEDVRADSARLDNTTEIPRRFQVEFFGPLEIVHLFADNHEVTDLTEVFQSCESVSGT